MSTRRPGHRLTPLDYKDPACSQVSEQTHCMQGGVLQYSTCSSLRDILENEKKKYLSFDFVYKKF